MAWPIDLGGGEQIQSHQAGTGDREPEQRRQGGAQGGVRWVATKASTKISVRSTSRYGSTDIARSGATPTSPPRADIVSCDGICGGALEARPYLGIGINLTIGILQNTSTTLGPCPGRAGRGCRCKRNGWRCCVFQEDAFAFISMQAHSYGDVHDTAADPRQPSSVPPYVQRAMIALTQKRVPVAARRIDIDLAAKPAWFQAISPLGKVPLLRAGEVVLFESAAILEYLEETQPGPCTPHHRCSELDHRAWIEFGSTVLADIAGLYAADRTRRPSAIRSTRSKASSRGSRPGSAAAWFDGERVQPRRRGVRAHLPVFRCIRSRRRPEPHP